MTISDLIISGFTFIAFVIGLAIFIKPTIHGINNRLLGTAFIILSVFCSYILLRSTGLLVQFPILLRVSSPYIYLMGPLFFLYIRNEILLQGRLSSKDWLHFLPAILHFLDLLPFYFTDIEVKRQLAEQIAIDVNVLFREGGGVIPIVYHYIFRIVSLLIYALLIAKVVFFSKHETSIVLKLKWLRIVALTYLSIVFLFTAMLISGLTHFDPTLESFDGAFVAMFLCLVVIVVFGVNLFSNTVNQPLAKQQLNNFQGAPVEEEWADTTATKTYLTDKYGGSKGKQMAEGIKTHINDRQVFTNPSLKVSDISAAFGLPVRDISFLVNLHLNTRVNDLVNAARVEEAKRLMDLDMHTSKTFDAIGSEAGFNSRSTFYRIFKQIENCTPHEYSQQKES